MSPLVSLLPTALVAETVEDILATAREMLDMEISFLSEVVEPSGVQVFQRVDGDGDSFGLRDGARAPLAQSPCRLMLEGAIPNAVGDAGADMTLCSLPVIEEAGIGAYIGVPVHLPSGRLYGSLCCLSHSSRELGERETRFLTLLGRLLGQALQRRAVQERDSRLRAQGQGLDALLAALEARDDYTGEHSACVVGLAVRCAGSMGLPEPQVAEVEQVALLHDIGKVGVPDAILRKPGPLTDAEWQVMREHPKIGSRIVGAIDTLRHLAPAIRAEHERWDGQGYPDGLLGREIPIASRIVFVCDAYHAMVSDRPYRKALGPDRARREILGHAGTQFCPDAARALLAAV